MTVLHWFEVFGCHTMEAIEQKAIQEMNGIL
jgi:hypothetical protein